MRAALVILGMSMASCGGGGGGPMPSDAAVVAPDGHAPEGCPALPDRNTFDFFGEACVAQPYPVNTLCHDAAGWCIDGTCRPQAGAHCPLCPAGTEHLAPAGAAYCAP